MFERRGMNDDGSAFGGPEYAIFVPNIADKKTQPVEAARKLRLQRLRHDMLLLLVAREDHEPPRGTTAEQTTNKALAERATATGHKNGSLRKFQGGNVEWPNWSEHGQDEALDG